MITIKSNGYTYKGNSKSTLGKFDITLKDKEFVSILGKSGCGKSTLIKLITKYLKSDTVEINGVDLTKCNYITQRGSLLPNKTVLKNMYFELKRYGIDKTIWDYKINQACNMAKLDKGLLNKYPHELSGGQLQRASLACSVFLTEPTLIVLDEPLSALDPIIREEIQLELSSIKIKNSNAIIIMITHDVNEAFMYSDKIILMNQKGDIDVQGNPNELYKKYLNNELSEYACKIMFNKTIPTIHYDSWRSSAKILCDRTQSDYIQICNDNLNIVGKVYKDTLIESLNNNDNFVHLTDLIGDI